VRCGSIGGLEYEVPQSRLYCLCINVALCSTALQCICRVIRSCDTKKFHDNESTHILHNFWTSTHREEVSPLPLPLAAPLSVICVCTFHFVYVQCASIMVGLLLENFEFELGLYITFVASYFEGATRCTEIC